MNPAPIAVARVVRRFDVPPERVFDAWLDPKKISQWMFGPRLREEEILHIELDARTGGSFSFLVRRGGEEIDHVGDYLEIDRPRRLVFTWSIAPDRDPRSRVTVEIAPAAGGCLLTLEHELPPEWASYLRRTEEGWTRMVDELATIDR